MKTVFKRRDAELLSSYLDDQLDSHQRAILEERLRQEVDLREFYENMRRTRLLLRQLSPHPIPRNFTVHRTSVPSAVRIPTFQTILRFSSALAALALIVVFAIDFLFISRAAPQLELARSVETQAILRDEQVISPPIITWGNPLMAGGMGGGGSDQPGLVTSYQIPRDLEIEASEEIILSAPQPESSAEILPPSPQEEALSAPQPQPEKKVAPITGYGPLLGVVPTEQRGQIIARFPTVPLSQEGSHALNLRWIEIILALLALLFAAIPYILTRKNHPSSLNKPG